LSGAITSCRGCGGDRLGLVLDLGDLPLANRLLDSPGESVDEPRYPLAVAMCADCCLVQTTFTVDPAVLFDDYPYFSSVSAATVEHYRAVARRLMRERSLGAGAVVVEVGSNDGYLLAEYAEAGVTVLGIEPAANVAAVATERGIPTRVAFFGASVAEELLAQGVRADVIHANNVLAHAPDINSFVAGLAKLLAPDGVLVVETPYLVDLVETVAFDTIYHEHVFYYSLTALTWLFERHGLAITDVEHVDTHGGSLRVFATRADTAHAASSRAGPRVGEMLAAESGAGVCSAEYFASFAQRVAELGEQLRSELRAVKVAGGCVVGYGAAAKAATLLNVFRIDAELLDFVCDLSPHKVGRYMPGVRLPIRPASDLATSGADVCLILAWNHAAEIVEQQRAFLDAGGTFIVPIPNVRTIA
jgi:SAM-dependent methyltransferase